MIKKIISKIQNIMFEIGSKKFKEEQNKILFIGSYQQIGSIMKELKKDKNNIIIRGSNFIGRSLFRKDVDYYVTAKTSEEDVNNLLKNIDVIVTTNDTVPFENNVIKTANKLGIPSIIIQHGALGEDESFKKSITTKVAIWGELTKEWMTKLGEDENKLIITGSPRYDSYITKKPKEKEKILKKFNIPKSKKIILYAPHQFNIKLTVESTQLTLEENKKTLDKLFNAAKEFGLFLIIKLHPSNQISIKEIYKLVPEIGYGDYCIIKHGQEDLFNLIGACDIFTTFTSTTALEAMLLKKPIVTMNFFNKIDAMHYSTYGCAIQATDDETLKKAIKCILDEKEVRDKLEIMSDKFMNNYCYKLDGLSSKRVAGLIASMKKVE